MIFIAFWILLVATAPFLSLNLSLFSLFHYFFLHFLLLFSSVDTIANKLQHFYGINWLIACNIFIFLFLQHRDGNPRGNPSCTKCLLPNALPWMRQLRRKVFAAFEQAYSSGRQWSLLWENRPRWRREPAWSGLRCGTQNLMLKLKGISWFVRHS